MTKELVTESDFIRLFKEMGAHKLAERINCGVGAIYQRRRNLERKHGAQITGPTHHSRTRNNISHPHEIHLDISDGIVVIGSDAHIWPGPASTAMRAFIHFCKEMKQKAVILNGDVIDACSISRHPPIGWENLPTVQQEIEAAQDRLSEIEKAAGRARKIWTLGNHDSRFETRLATVASEFAKLHGMHLRDYFPLWEPCWLAFINNDVVVKHRFKGGIHAPHNNTMWAGKSIFTGHLHSAKVIPLTDYNGTRYGVDSGCLADTEHKAFVDYTEGGPKNWRSAFSIATFHKGRLMQPELVLVWDDDHVEFRGGLIRV